jgi:hypothetical protein
MIKNRAENAANWEFDMLLVILIRQFKRLLAERDVELTEDVIRSIAAQAAARQSTGEKGGAVIHALRSVVDESLAVLAAWGLSYGKSLKTTMDNMPGWESTADFLTLANEKGNAELRISSGASLLAGLGDDTHADKLWSTYQHGKDDPEDVDAVIARRTLVFLAEIDAAAPDWEDQTRQWLTERAKV